MNEAPRLHVVPGEQIRGSRPEKRPGPEPVPEPLWREVLGEQLRELRRRNQKTLTETAARAGISPQYLSEVERGLKEPSSEMIAAVAGALGTTLGGLTESVAAELRPTHKASWRRDEVGARRSTTGPVLLALAA
ncbi:MAG TPA: helix-turn-helix transcriptional regulator [Actinocrinis sp.]|uniref:helix-turn-helix domain-containing protein n=1 Tax=Actinocrinis sp. TaxID=1920516 RepID=UPI002D5F6BE8|nr:helix-turn-helix transcriptional regulator [Actinocrinis sp.]HZU55543.1 helix-turn-helix transcriptional regulator [Actinocrinis sp.]